MQDPTPIRGRRLLSDTPDEKTFDSPYGIFTLRRPSLDDQRRIHIEAARALEGLTNVDPVGELTNIMMATITICARHRNQRANEAPRGWPKDFSWDKAYEYDFLNTLYNAFSEWVSSFRKPEGTDEGEGRGAGVGEEQAVPTATGVQLGTKEP